MNNIPLFYIDLIQFWFELKAKEEPQTTLEIKREVLWFNPFIKIDGNYILYKNWYNKGIVFINDITDANGELMKIYKGNTVYISTFWNIVA